MSNNRKKKKGFFSWFNSKSNLSDEVKESLEQSHPIDENSDTSLHLPEEHKVSQYTTPTNPATAINPCTSATSSLPDHTLSTEICDTQTLPDSVITHELQQKQPLCETISVNHLASKQIITPAPLADTQNEQIIATQQMTIAPSENTVAQSNSKSQQAIEPTLSAEQIIPQEDKTPHNNIPTPPHSTVTTTDTPHETSIPSSASSHKESKQGFLNRLKQRLTKTKQQVGQGLFTLFQNKKIDEELFDELADQLIIADVGVPTTQKIIDNLRQVTKKQKITDSTQLFELLKKEMVALLKKIESPLILDNKITPTVLLMVGVNGVGKTTTIGKLAKQFQMQGKKVMLVAGDTFRAAAIEQLQVWGERNNIPVVAQTNGADAASVIFDAVQMAKARNIDVLIADTAGRLQNKSHLMDELKKIVRVMQKIIPEAPHEVILTLDAATGQNAIAQVKLFSEAVGLTGLILTKLDGTAKGGVIFAIADQFPIAIPYIGIGESIDDLREFNANDFIHALFSTED